MLQTELKNIGDAGKIWHGCRLPVRLLGFALAAAATVVFAASAQAASTFVLRGAGFGHGIGMSQYGAQGYATHGRSYKQIIGHYYTGTDIGQAKSKTIRVLLQASIGSAKVSGASKASGGKTLDPDLTYTIKRRGNSVELSKSNGDVIDSYTGTLLITGSTPMTLRGKAINGVSGGRYRGSYEISAGAVGGVTVVNAADLDDYVQGVVPGEVPASWHVEALKAQSVAARSYALTTDAGGSLFDQYPDTRSQVYRGVTAEQKTTNSAVQATSGEVAYYKNKVAVTYFFSTSGGKTEDVQNVFYGAKATPYLVSVDDPYDDISPRHRWRFKFTARQMKAKLGALVKGSFRGVKVTRRGESPRVVTAIVRGSRGNTTTTGATLRARLGLPDTWVTFKKVKVKRATAAAAVAKVWPFATAATVSGLQSNDLTP